MTAFLSWQAVTLAVLAAGLVTPAVCSWLERRADKRDLRDMELWLTRPGAVR